jgi:hypothetical protein
MNYLLNKEFDVKILSSDLQTVKFSGTIKIEPNWTILKLKSDNNIEDLKGVFARLKNGSLLFLIHGTVNSIHHNSVDPHQTFRFYETLYFTDYFKDEYYMVKCEIPLLSNWFNSQYYSYKSDENNTIIKIQNENDFIIDYDNFKIILYHEARLTLGQSVLIKPLTYLIIRNTELLERHQLNQILNASRQFYQSFLLETLHGFNLYYVHNESNIISHSINYPFREDTELQRRCTTWFEFSEVKNELFNLFHKWIACKEENIAIGDLFQDSFKNSSPINRFLSAMRILEILSKRVSDASVKNEELQWKQAINATQILKNEKKFAQSWILRPFIKYKNILGPITDIEIINFIKNRNYYTHRGYKINGVVNPEFIQKLTNQILGIAKTIFFLQIGIKEEIAKRVMYSFNSGYYFEPIDNQYSSFYRKEES